MRFAENHKWPRIFDQFVALLRWVRLSFCGYSHWLSAQHVFRDVMSGEKRADGRRVDRVVHILAGQTIK